MAGGGPWLLLATDPSGCHDLHHPASASASAKPLFEPASLYLTRPVKMCEVSMGSKRPQVRARGGRGGGDVALLAHTPLSLVQTPCQAAKVDSWYCLPMAASAQHFQSAQIGKGFGSTVSCIKKSWHNEKYHCKQPSSELEEEGRCLAAKPPWVLISAGAYARSQESSQKEAHKMSPTGIGQAGAQPPDLEMVQN